jgi:hypothetical protein
MELCAMLRVWRQNSPRNLTAKEDSQHAGHLRTHAHNPGSSELAIELLRTLMDGPRRALVKASAARQSSLASFFAGHIHAQNHALTGLGRTVSFGY